MTLVVWALYKLVQKGRGEVRTAYVIAAVLTSALLFAAGHLPAAAFLAGGLDPALVVYVLVANSLFGIAAGLLYWKRGLESAMIAHIFAHVVMVAAIKFNV